MDRSVAPGDDFFVYANGTWIKATPIPADKSDWGASTELAEVTLKRTHGLLAEAAQSGAPAGSELRKIADYYTTFMDEAAIEAKGLSLIKPALDRIDRIADRGELASVLGEELRADVDPLNTTDFQTERLFGLWVGPDFNAPGTHIPYLLQGGLGLPDREYYLKNTPRMAQLRSKYQAHIAAVFKLVGAADAEAKAARIMALETKMARVHASREESEDVIKANNPWKRSEFVTRAPGLAWDAFFRAAGLAAVPTVMVWHPRATQGLSALTASEPLPTWREWLAFHLIERRSPFLSKAFVNENFAFHDKILSGTPELAERWKRGVLMTDAAIGYGVGKLYVKKYFPPQSKAQVQQMVNNIRAAFADRIDKIDWMAPATKAKAKEKLATLYVGVGYPETWRDYSALTVVPGDVVGNAERAELFEYKRCLAKLNQPVDQSEWAMTPQTVNAINLPIQNAINFPAAVLQPPFFDPAASPATNYGSIGATIGHEISHSFDDQGAKFDAHGKLFNWWTPEDLVHFKAAGAKLAAQFDAYRPLPDLHVNGKLTLSENISDLAGLSAAADAWRKSLGGQSPAVVQGFSGDQLFFLAYAQSWRNKLREPALRQQIVTDPHAPDHYRANTVRNLDAWYKAFGAKPGQSLFLTDRDRVRVW